MDEPCDEDIITKIKESRRANIVVTVTPENSDTDEEPLNEEEAKEMTLTNPMPRFSISIFIRMHPKLQLRSLCNFTYEQLEYLADIIESNCGRARRGRKVKFSTIESLFLTLTYYCTYLPYSALCPLLHISQSCYSKLVTRTTNVAFPIFASYFLPNHCPPLTSMKNKFTNFPDAVAAVDSTTIPFNIPSVKEERLYSWDEKNHCNGIKLQVLVSPDGKAIHQNVEFMAAVHDKKIFDLSKVSDFLTVKRGFDDYQYPVLADRGYIGIQKYHLTAVVMKRSHEEADVERNNAIAQDRQIVERFFARFKSCWSCMKNGFRGERTSLPLIISGLVGLTNYNIDGSPLNDNEELLLFEDFTPTKVLPSSDTVAAVVAPSMKPSKRNIIAVAHQAVDIIQSSQEANYLYPIKGGIVGLHNMGNTCHLNVCLQVLFYISEVRTEVLKVANQSSPIVTEMSSIFTNLNSLKSKGLVFVPHELATLLGNSTYEAQDCDDTMTRLITDLAEQIPGIGQLFRITYRDSANEQTNCYSIHTRIGEPDLDHAIQYHLSTTRNTSWPQFLTFDIQREWQNDSIHQVIFDFPKKLTLPTVERQRYQLIAIVAYCNFHYVVFLQKSAYWIMINDEVAYSVPSTDINALKGCSTAEMPPLWYKTLEHKWLAKMLIYRMVQ
ncbi:DDE endonuclease family [Trichomonas vaginalis G3]|nr:DDE endonuclease family [Trichomonas vaginalis G3]XP_001317355.2 ZGC:162945 family [Trichomonas vaginalis G3]XP_051102896.1 DDE endonuclease family [Trichomonas vaginalis G3]XP_051112134.1 DDE endonuclease family [Trichomonas vaginalis G3]KAI5505797.1 DDE endonuclease family [Trichomonas vaginalis G3]KAI5510942.1 ZGC:162945 family [Trichomonas vaginalis G3]KAI5535491.1 DDE endonuclease family [Trichomonas vaginalis G3]KAI5552252.1 DDE endonuclease family [Trichomonas vaginalis G3]